MSGDRPTASREARTVWAPLPLTEHGRLDKKRLKEIYDNSPYVEWVPFCEARDWNAAQLRHKCPAQTWVAAKKTRIRESMGEELRQNSLELEQRWVKDVKKTLTEYPKAVDNIMVLAQNMMQRIAQDQEAGLHTKWKTGDLFALAATIKTCAETKKSLLMLNDVVIKKEEALPAPDQQQGDGNWVMTFKGEKDVTPKKLTALMLDYLDKPQSDVEDAKS